MDFRLRQDPRVRLLEKTNARYLTHDLVGEHVALVAMDVSFISATLVLPAVVASAFPKPEAHGSPCRLVVLVKPQFEAGRGEVGKGGIVRDEKAHRDSVERVRQCVVQLGATKTDATDSPITGAEGTREFLLYAEF
jgi:23S rRNA (cytidine1920-2'-O)/16S rRNA (cytidine1409-2'-O)-methyltransferase